jgi:hypothetical protein
MEEVRPFSFMQSDSSQAKICDSSLFLNDCVEITGIMFDILNKYEDGLDNFTSIYDCYRLLDTVLHQGSHRLLKGFMSQDVSGCNGTESFKTPLDKWVYFSNEGLKKFNDELVPFMKYLTAVLIYNNQLFCTPEAAVFKTNLRQLSRWQFDQKYDNKLYISQDGSKIYYEYYSYTYDAKGWCVGDELFFKPSYFDISTNEKKHQLLDCATIMLNCLQEYKGEFEKLLLKKCTLGDLFTKNGMDIYQ